MHKIHKSTKQQTTGQKIPTIVNGQTQYTDNGKLPASNNKNNFQTPTTNRVNRLKEYSKCSKHASQKQHKVVILGDSHARGCAAGVKHLLSSDFEVFGSINPGAGMKTMKDTASVKVQQTKKDVVVLWGGSNDIARNNSLVGLKHILEFLINANHTNVILLTAPHRHDLITNSCVNKEVEVFNKKLHKKVERFKKVEIIDVVNERNCYTRHGQHLNSAGKDSMSKRITTTIEHLFNSDKEPIRGEWYKDEKTDSPKHQASQDATSSDPEEAKNECSECNSATGASDSLTVRDTEKS